MLAYLAAKSGVSVETLFVQILDAYSIQHINELVAHLPSSPDSLGTLTEAGGRETMALFAWNIRNLHRYSMPFAASGSWHFVQNLVRIVRRF